MRYGTVLIPGNLMRFSRAKELNLGYGIANAKGNLSGRGSYRFPRERYAMFIRGSAGAPEAIGIFLVDEQLIYVNYSEIEKVE